MSPTLDDQDKLVLRNAAYGAVTLMAAAAGADSPHKVATQGSIALTSATGLVGHVLAEKSQVGDLSGKSAAEIADRVLPALTRSMELLKEQVPEEAENFRGTVLVAVEASARTGKGEPQPTLTAMSQKITQALDAA
ncbi:hypothetical protein G6045_02155 [Streptomyces sp. YC504]|uniref:Uncharacterized protein n=1 Tax=Streptomyces mesophilus TaxID=1775132 RepID=A0A6G4XCW6_9ACTN|nr:hypothetical protein [Streptomyces mesophilus]NGO74491.1 hypothetical protein [Streptomyces mesophilus]